MSNIKLSIRKLLTLAFDLFCFLGVLLLCLQPYTTAQGPVAIIEQNRLIVIIYLVISIFTFLLFRCYNELIRDYSLFNALKIGGAIIASHIIFGVFMAIIEQPLPFTLILNLAIYAVTVIGIYRLIVLSAYNIFSHLPRAEKASDQKRAIIFGAGHAGKYLVDMLNYDKSKKMIPVAFIDDNPKLERRRIKGLLVEIGRAHV